MTAPTPAQDNAPSTELERVQAGVIDRLLQRNTHLTLQVSELDTRYDMAQAELDELRKMRDEVVEAMAEDARGGPRPAAEPKGD